MSQSFFIYIYLFNYNTISVSHFNLLFSSTISPTDLNQQSGLNNPHRAIKSAVHSVVLLNPMQVSVFGFGPTTQMPKKLGHRVTKTKRSVSMWFTVKQWKCTQLSRCQRPNVIHLNENPFHAAYQTSKILTHQWSVSHICLFNVRVHLGKSPHIVFWKGKDGKGDWTNQVSTRPAEPVGNSVTFPTGSFSLVITKLWP